MPNRRKSNIVGDDDVNSINKSSNKDTNVEEWVSRLYQKPDKYEKKKKHVATANDALISALPSDTLKWMRQRRTPNYTGKVAISIFQERQLREIFNGLDLENNGVIDLGQLQEAALYVESSTKDSVLPLKNVFELFANMDDDGNGEVDFHEFTQAMIISKSRSEIEVQRMHQKFVEFAFMKKREYSLRCIEQIRKKVESEIDDDSVNSKSKKEQREIEFDVVQAGVQAYRLFRNLFQGKQVPIPDEADDGSPVTKTKTNTLSSSHIDINIIEDKNKKLKKYIKYVDQLNGYDYSQTAKTEEVKNDDDEEQENIPKFRRKSTFRDALTEYDNTISDLTISNTDTDITNTNTDSAEMNNKTDTSSNTIDTKETRYRELRERLLNKKKQELLELEKDPDGRHLMKRLEEEKLFDIELNKLITPKATLDNVKCKIGKLVLPKETLIPVEDTVKAKMKSKMKAGKLSQDLLPTPIIEKTYLKPVGNLKETNTTINSMKVNYSVPQLEKIETFPLPATDGRYHLSNSITWKDKKLPSNVRKKLAENRAIFS